MPGSRRTSLRGLALVPLLVLLAAPPVLGQARHGPIPEAALGGARARMRELLADFPGLSVALGRHGEILWEEGFGVADLDGGRPVTAATRFRIYSLAKPITSIALLQLADAGRLDLDAPVHEIVPAAPSRPTPVTPRLLATHMAGIRHYADDAEAYDPGHCDSVDEALSLFVDDPLLHAPGSAVRYSTWGFVLLSAAIERASGRDYLDYLAGRVFEPVGAAPPRLDPGPGAAAVAATAVPYDRDDEGAWARSASDASCKWGGGGLLASASDLARVFMGVMTGALLSSSARERYFAPATSPSGETVKGLGMSVVTRDGLRVSGAMGAGPGGRAQLGMIHDLGVVMVILGNAAGGGVDTEAVMRRILLPLLQAGVGPPEGGE